LDESCEANIVHIQDNKMTNQCKQLLYNNTSPLYYTGKYNKVQASIKGS